MRIRLAHGLALALSVVSLGAAQGPSSSGSEHARIYKVRPTGQAASQKAGRKKPYQVGTASWYGSAFVGKPTASGEP